MRFDGKNESKFRHSLKFFATCAYINVFYSRIVKLLPLLFNNNNNNLLLFINNSRTADRTNNEEIVPKKIYQR